MINTTRTLACLSTLWVGATHLVGQEGQVSTQRLYRLAEPAVVMVEVYGPRDQTPTGRGSGFFISSDGIAVTNYHVVDGATQAVMRDAHGGSCTVLGFVAADARSDLVVLKCNWAGSRTIPLGNSDSISPGAEVVAIGGPRGFQSTISTGVVSGARVVDGVQYLQHSAPISPGSSGGPLLSSRGYAVGINAVGITDAQNLNFAVPINALRRLLPGDTVRPLSALPRRAGGAEQPVAVNDVPGPPIGPPIGMTNVYLLENAIAGFAFAFIVELPSHALRGTLFWQHRSGFFDVVPVRWGTRPGRWRDFVLSAGCGDFSGWIRNTGILSGDLTTDCSGTTATEAFTALPFTSDPDRREGFAGAKLWLVQLTNPAGDSLWGLLATIAPSKLPEAAVGSLDAWRTRPGQPTARYDVSFGRGHVTEAGHRIELSSSDGESLKLQANAGAVRGSIAVGPTASNVYSAAGYRFDLVGCFSRDSALKADSAELLDANRLRPLYSDSIKIAVKLQRAAGPVSAIPRGAPDSVRSRINAYNASVLHKRSTAKQAEAAARLAKDRETTRADAAYRRISSMLACPPLSP